jgi:hypothetical protein
MIVQFSRSGAQSHQGLDFAPSRLCERKEVKDESSNI